MRNSFRLVVFWTVVFSPAESLDIRSALARSDDQSKLKTFLKSIPEEMQPESVKKEDQLRAQIDTALEERDFRKLFSLIEDNEFESSSHQVLQEIWYKGHYLETEMVRGRTLCSVERYRLRKKYPPPKSIWDGEKTLYKFKSKALQILQIDYSRNRMPSLEEKQVLAKTTGMTISQVNAWFKNRRHRDRPRSSLSSSSSFTTATSDSRSYG